MRPRAGHRRSSSGGQTTSCQSSRSGVNRAGGSEQPQGSTVPVDGPVATTNATGSPQVGQSGNGVSSPASGSLLIGPPPRVLERVETDSNAVVTGDATVVRDVYIPVERTESWLANPLGLEAESRVLGPPGTFRDVPCRRSASVLIVGQWSLISTAGVVESVGVRSRRSGGNSAREPMSPRGSVLLSWQHGVATPSPTDSLAPESLAHPSHGFELCLTSARHSSASATAWRFVDPL